MANQRRAGREKGAPRRRRTRSPRREAPRRGREEAKPQRTAVDLDCAAGVAVDSSDFRPLDRAMARRAATT
jgi:hypothetical protein